MAPCEYPLLSHIRKHTKEQKTHSNQLVVVKLQSANASRVASKHTHNLARVQVPDPDRSIPRASHQDGESRVSKVFFNLQASDGVRVPSENLNVADASTPIALDDQTLGVD